MPVTAKLSKQFYDRLGEAVTNELVDWFNQVDTAYKSDLRDMNELNFARFDATLEMRLTSFEAKVEQRLTSFEAKVEQRLTSLEAKFDQRLASLDGKVEQRLSALDAKIDVTAARLTAAIEKAKSDQTRFLFLAWAALFATILPLWFR